MKIKKVITFAFPIILLALLAISCLNFDKKQNSISSSIHSATEIDTSWMHDPNTPIYAGFFRKASFYKVSNSIRLSEIRRFISSCEALIDAINNELTNR